MNVTLDHNQWHTHFRWDSPGGGIGPSQRPLPDKTQDSQVTDIHAYGGIRTHNPSKRMAADLRLRPRSHRDLLLSFGTKYSYQHSILNAVCATKSKTFVARLLFVWVIRDVLYLGHCTVSNIQEPLLSCLLVKPESFITKTFHSNY